MKALLYSDWGRLEVADVPEPVAGEHEVLVRVEACGICGSELECFERRSPRRTPPLILGHEFCGRVEALGKDVSGCHVGQPVIANSVIPCGQCLPCRRGETNLCGKRKLFGMHRPGACAELVAAPVSVVYPRPEGMDPVAGALVEPASNGVHVMHLLPGQPRKTVFVFGAGVIGLMVMQAARALAGARVAVADMIPERLECARTLGAEQAVNAGTEDVVEAGIAFSRADGVDYAVDAVGAAATKRQSLRIARPGGAVCWLGLRDDQLELESYGVTLPQKTITGSYASTEQEYLEAAHLLHAGRIRTGNWVKTFPLADAVAAFHRMSAAEGDDIKAVILP